MAEPTTVLAHYRVRAGMTAQFLTIVARHWAALHELGLVTDRPAEVYQCTEQHSDASLIVEVFEWVDDDASRRAHTHPRISQIWEAMGPLCEDRDGHAAFDFPHGHRVLLP